MTPRDEQIALMKRHIEETCKMQKLGISILRGLHKELANCMKGIGTKSTSDIKKNVEAGKKLSAAVGDIASTLETMQQLNELSVKDLIRLTGNRGAHGTDSTH